MTPTTTTNTKTKTVFQKAPFRVLAALLVIEGVMIGQVLSRPGGAKEPTAKAEATATASLNTKYADCKEIVNLWSRRDCWVKRVKAKDRYLQGAHLSEAHLTKMELSEVNLSGADLSKASLDSADLSDANLSGANLSGAIMGFANLRDANLSGADLRGTILVGADLSGAKLDGIKKDKKTKGLPRDL